MTTYTVNYKAPNRKRFDQMLAFSKSGDVDVTSRLLCASTFTTKAEAESAASYVRPLLEAQGVGGAIKVVTH